MDYENMGDHVLERKYEELKQIIADCGSALVAFSSGVDSTFLLKTARDVLGDRVLAVTAATPFFPKRESRETMDFCEQQGIRHIICDFDGLSVPGFQDNPTDRCYICKKALFTEFLRLAREEGLHEVLEGSNTDDSADFRPGHRAIRELGIRSPLKEAGLSKDDIRQLSRALDLPTWNKPSFACLASRFPYGENISKSKLAMVEKAEDFLLSLGFRQMRVRIHETVSGALIARIELPEEEYQRMMEPALRLDIRLRLTSLGFDFISLDLAGYRTGSMNRGLSMEKFIQGLDL